MACSVSDSDTAYYRMLVEHYREPRADLAEDSELWGRLLWLCLAPEAPPDLCAVLWGMRCCGLRLAPGARHPYVLRPTLDPTGAAGWVDEAAYAADRERWLRPHAGAIARLLAALAEDVRAEEERDERACGVPQPVADRLGVPCPGCRGETEYREGVSKAGREYAGYFCLARCGAAPRWARR